MSKFLLSLLFLLQGIPVQQGGGGKVTGVLRDSLGIPLAGIRVAAVARGDTVEAAAAGAAMAGLSETDEHGRFTLEDIPAGRYAIAAGRLDQQTYYPGTRALADARVLTVTAGETIAGINFVLNSASFGRSPSGFEAFGARTPTVTATIPVQVVTEGGAKLPVWANGAPASLRLDSTAFSPFRISIDGSSFSIPGPSRGNFRVFVENLPDNYEVKSIAYGSSEILGRTFMLSEANFPTVTTAPTSVNALTFSGTLAPVSTVVTVLTYSGLKPAAIPPSSLSITIAKISQSPAEGVTITGGTGTPGQRSIYISGKPGTFYSDGTFEFRGVAAGRHLIATPGSAKPLGAVVIVGDSNIDGIELKETFLLPENISAPKAPAPAGAYPPGTIVPMARVRGVVLDAATKEPIREGAVEIKAGSVTRRISIDAEGRFETFHLLPGTYDLRLQIFGHSSNGVLVTIEDKDVTVELTTQRFY